MVTTDSHTACTYLLPLLLLLLLLLFIHCSIAARIVLAW
jgi:hypothetical protein